jgi:hypothetical protein
MNTSYTYTYQALGHTIGIWSAEVWETDVNPEDNSSVININFYVRVAHDNQVSNTYNDSNTAWSDITIDGERVLFQAPSNYDLRYNDLKQVPNGFIYELGKITKKIYHDKDGSKTINIVCRHNCGDSAPGTVTCQGDFTLERINVKTASTMTFDNSVYNADSIINMTISASHSHFKHEVVLVYGAYSQEYENLSAGNHKITLPENWRTVLIAGKTANVSAYCFTYDGDKLIGEDKKTLTISNPDTHASLYVPDGVFNIGGKVDFTVNTTNDYMTYTIDYNTTEYPTWILHTIGEKLTKGSHTFTLKEIPWAFKNGLMDQELTTMNIRLRTYHSGELVGTEIKEVFIRNDAYILNIDASINQNAYKENGHYIAGLTRFQIDYNLQSSFEVSSLKIEIIGANSDYEQIDTPKKSGSWTSDLLKYEGQTIVRLTATDVAGHVSSYDIDTVIAEDTSTLVIKRFEELNKKVFLKDAKPNAAHKFKIYLAWENNYPIEGIKFEVTGANTFTKEVNAPTGTSYTWETDEVTQEGVNMVNVVIADTNGSIKTSSFTVKSLIKEETIELDGTCVDKNICIGLVDNEIYKDETRIGIKISVKHIYTIEKIRILINDREQQLLDFDGNATTFFYIDDRKIEVAGTIPIIVAVKDATGEEVAINLSATSYEPEIGPEVPEVDYDDNTEEKIFISEGERLTFRGCSTDLADYQIIYAVAECDIIKATQFCDHLDGSYLNADRHLLRKHCLAHVAASHRFHILKDFGVSGDDTFIHQDAKCKNKFHIYPYDEEMEGFYALQFFPEARPGDLVYIYVRERRKCAFGRWAYSDHWHHHHNIPIAKFFPVCVIPAAPLSLTIYKVEKTDSKLTIQYKNPLYDVENPKKDAIHLIDVCLIVKDNAGNILDTQGKRSKSDTRCRDALWGRTWLYFTERRWHNCVPRGTTGYNDKEIFDMTFDISRYPKDSNMFVVAFYYVDYYRNPSIYSTSNIININKPTLNMNIQFLEPENETVSLTPNPTFKLRVSKVEEDGVNYTTIYENFNFAIKWHRHHWHKHPIWFRCPRRLDCQMPHFLDIHCHRHCHPWHNAWHPHHHIHHWHKHHHCHHDHHRFKIPELPVNSESNFKDSALFISANDNNHTNIGEIDVDTLLEQGYIDFNWKQEDGQFLSIGENKIEAYTCPYKEVEQKKIEHDDLDGYWLSDKTFISMPVMPWNPFAHTALKPYDDPWDRVESTVLHLKFPYRILKENRTYTLKFLSFADRGFHYPHRCCISHKHDLDRLCSARIFIDVVGVKLKACKWIHDNIIYRPAYQLIDTTITEAAEVNHYGRWMTHTVSFTTPDLDDFNESIKLGHFIKVIVKIRGIHRLKVKGVTLTCSDNTPPIEVGKGEIDTSKKENKTQMTLVYPGVITPNLPDLPDGYIHYDYVNPLRYDDILNLRRYLETVSQVYGVSNVVMPTWRTLIRDQSYLQARDFNDIKEYCIKLFTAISDKYKTTFKGDIGLFRKLPTIQINDRRGPKDFSNRGKHYFPEWDDLIDALNAQITKPTIVLGTSTSVEGATWSQTDNKWIRHNQPVLLRNTTIIPAPEPEPLPPSPVEEQFKSISCATWYRKFWDNPFTNWDNWYPNNAYIQYKECMFHNSRFENFLILTGRETMVKEAFYFFGDKLMKLKNVCPNGEVTFTFHFIPLKFYGPEVPPGIRFNVYSHPYSSILTAHGTRNTLCSHAVHLGYAEMLPDGLTMVFKTNMSKLKKDVKGVIITCSAISHYMEGDFRLRDYCSISVKY